MQADGYSLDDKRNELDGKKHENNNIPDIINRWNNRKDEKERKRTDQSFFVSKHEISENGYDLSINRYKEIVYDEVRYDSPQSIIAEMKALEEEILSGMNELEEIFK